MTTLGIDLYIWSRYVITGFCCEINNWREGDTRAIVASVPSDIEYERKRMMYCLMDCYPSMESRPTHHNQSHLFI